MPLKPVVLLTGFEPFSGQLFNVSAEGIRLFCEAGDQGARALLSHGMQIEAPGGILRDIDTPEDLERVRRLIRA